MKKALVHDWYTVYGGAERCVESFSDIWNVYGHFSLFDDLSCDDRDIILKGRRTTNSFIQKSPFWKKKCRSYLPLFPKPIEQFDLKEYDLIISLSSSVVKGVLTRPGQLDIPYLKLFGIEDNPQILMGIVRSGTFKEGNFFGLFLLLSGKIALNLKKNRTAIFLLLSILITLSTMSIVSALLFLFFYFKRIILRIIIVISPFILIATFAFSKTEFYHKNVYAKLFTPVSTLT